MFVVRILVESVGLILGSMAAGIFACWLLWSAFRMVRHPEWGPPLVLVPCALALTGHLRVSEFLAMALIFAAVAVIPFCAEGRAWRGRARIATDATAYPRYPAIVACIGEARRPSPAELKRVAARMLREASDAKAPTAGFAARRAVLRSAKAALAGMH